MVLPGIRKRRQAPPSQPPITRREYARRGFIRMGVSSDMVEGLVSKVEELHPELNMDQLVDPDTGEPIQGVPTEETGG